MNPKIIVNNLQFDEFGRPSGVIATNKPVGITSHDVVYKARKKYQTKKVGHAGTLDPFASGLLLILLGKATKLSDQFLNYNKEYEAYVLFGVATTSADPEGEILKIEDKQIDASDLQTTLETFKPGYKQTVPLFSSVKVDGEKLRILARKYAKFEIVAEDQNKKVMFFDGAGGKKQEIMLPVKDIKIYEIELLELNFAEHFKDIFLSGLYMLSKRNSDFTLDPKKLQMAKIRVKCSKGTYIRQLAEDIGLKLKVPAMLFGLTRTAVGDIKLSDAIVV